MGIKRICNHCGRMYEATEGCQCMKKRQAENRKRYESTDKGKQKAATYHNVQWTALAEQVRMKYYYQDALQLWLVKMIQTGKLAEYRGRQTAEAIRILDSLIDLLVDRHGNPKPTHEKRKPSVHHIEPVEDNKARRYDPTNLIPISATTHSFIHELYDSSDKEKRAAMKILYDAIGENPPPLKVL